MAWTSHCEHLMFIYFSCCLMLTNLFIFCLLEQQQGFNMFGRQDSQQDNCIGVYKCTHYHGEAGVATRS